MSESAVPEAAIMASWLRLATNRGLAEWLAASQQDKGTYEPPDEPSDILRNRAERRLEEVAPDQVERAVDFAAEFATLACQPEAPKYGDADYSAADFDITER